MAGMTDAIIVTAYVSAYLLNASNIFSNALMKLNTF